MGPPKVHFSLHTKLGDTTQVRARSIKRILNSVLPIRLLGIPIFQYVYLLPQLPDLSLQLHQDRHEDRFHRVEPWVIPRGAGKASGLVHQAIERGLVFFAQRLSKALPVADQRVEHGPVGGDGSAHLDRVTKGSLLCKILSSFSSPFFSFAFTSATLSVTVYTLSAFPFEFCCSTSGT